MYLALSLKKNNLINEAINVLSQGINYFNKYFDALTLRAKLYIKIKNYDKAMKDLNLAIQINPKKSICYLGLSDCYK